MPIKTSKSATRVRKRLEAKYANQVAAPYLKRFKWVANEPAWWRLVGTNRVVSDKDGVLVKVLPFGKPHVWTAARMIVEAVNEYLAHGQKAVIRPVNSLGTCQVGGEFFQCPNCESQAVMKQFRFCPRCGSTLDTRAVQRKK